MRVQFVGHASRLWWDGVCNICKFRSARTGIKEALWGGGFIALQQNCANQCIDAANKIDRLRERQRERGEREREREKQRDRTSSEQLKGFINPWSAHLVGIT